MKITIYAEWAGFCGNASLRFWRTWPIGRADGREYEKLTVYDRPRGCDVSVNHQFIRIVVNGDGIVSRMQNLRDDEPQAVIFDVNGEELIKVGHKLPDLRYVD